MKKLAITFGILCLGIFVMFIEKDKKKGKKTRTGKGERLISVEAGPHGETILTGSHGGKYYMKNDRKIYIRH